MLNNKFKKPNGGFPPLKYIRNEFLNKERMFSSDNKININQIINTVKKKIIDTDEKSKIEQIDSL